MKFKQILGVSSIIAIFLSSFLLVLNFYEERKNEFLNPYVAEDLGLYDKVTHQSKIEQGEYYDSQNQSYNMGIRLNSEEYSAKLDKPEFKNINFRDLFSNLLIAKPEAKDFIVNSLKIQLDKNNQLIDKEFYWKTNDGESVPKYNIKIIGYSPVLSSIKESKGKLWIDKTVAKIAFINQENWQNKTLSTFLVKVKDSYLSVIKPTIDSLMVQQVLDYDFFKNEDLHLTAQKFNDLMTWKQPLNEDVIEFQKVAEFFHLKIKFRVWETFTKRYLEDWEPLKEGVNYSFTIFLSDIDTKMSECLNYI